MCYNYYGDFMIKYNAVSNRYLYKKEDIEESK